MQAPLHSRQILHYTNLMANGDPLWALLAVNDHLSKENPIRRAFVERARIYLPKVTHKTTKDLQAQAIAGRPLSTLSNTERWALRQASTQSDFRRTRIRWEPAPRAIKRPHSRRPPSRARRTLGLRSVVIARMIAAIQ